MEPRPPEPVAIVTGAGRGIGRSIALELSRTGMRVVLAARTTSELEAVAAECAAETLVKAVDLRDPGAPREVVRAAADTFDRIDLLVNCAGATTRGDFLEFADEEWMDGFGLKFFGAVRCSREAWPHLARAHGGIINIIGVGGKVASAEFSIGGSVNAALTYLTKSLAVRGAKDGIRVNGVNPGSIATARLRRRIERHAVENGLSYDESAARMARSLGVDRFGHPEEVARVVSFLASPQSGYIQGSILDVDGGQTRAL